MSKTKRINPNRRPMSVAKARDKVQSAADAFLMMALYALLDARFDPEMIRVFVKKFETVMELFQRDKLTIRDMQDAIREYEVELRRLDELKVKAFFMGG